jgi:hypothetical protein
VQYVLKLLLCRYQKQLSTTNSCFKAVSTTEVNPVGKFVTVASVALPPNRCRIAVPEHTVDFVFHLVNTIVEARLRVTVPDIVALYTQWCSMS